mmetsp:Transcript_11461/g.25175  ORF Transcript_11461/g.25175 Transcript_11461/m.25175 type:complete len:175 (+) Transcript_11461:94-618(+)
MKLSLKHILLVSAIALASQSSIVLAEEAAVTSDAADVAAEANVEEAVEADGDAGKECSADDSSCITPEEEPSAEDPKCPSRPHVIRCAAKYLDTNQNGALEREELDSAMGEVSWIVRGLLKVIGSTDAIMKKCDADGDGKIDIATDMEATKETCLASCFKRNAFKRLFFPECTE